jgi:5-methylcytosine-specific restriction endonuclease McrA
MKKNEYYEKLKDPRWQKKRLEIMDRDEWKCRRCGEKTKTLNVHHVAYFKDHEPWDTPNGFLMTLCEQCHKNNKDDVIQIISKILDYIFSIPGGLLAIRRLFKIE